MSSAAALSMIVTPSKVGGAQRRLGALDHVLAEQANGKKGGRHVAMAALSSRGGNAQGGHMRQVMPHCNKMVDDLRPCKSFLHFKSGGWRFDSCAIPLRSLGGGLSFPSAAQSSRELAAGEIE